MAWRKHQSHPLGIKGPVSGRSDGHTPKWTGSGWYETICPDCKTKFRPDIAKKAKCPKCPWIAQ